MKSPVIIKSFHNGIAVFLDATLPFQDILVEVGLKFRESASFFKNAKLAISFEGRELSQEEEELLIQQITDNCKMDIVCLVGKDKEKEETFFRAIQHAGQKAQEQGQFYRGSLRSGQTLEIESSIVVIGDVCQGSGVVAKKDIVIIGSLRGEAYAGAGGGEGHFVAALDMAPEKLKIDQVKYTAPKKSPHWLIRPKTQPKIAYVKEGSIVTEPITKELLNMLPI